jgi:hypothetical protein
MATPTCDDFREFACEESARNGVRASRERRERVLALHQPGTVEYHLLKVFQIVSGKPIEDDSTNR